MPEVHGSLTRVYMNGQDPSDSFREAEMGRMRELVDSTAFAATADAHLPSPVVAGELTAGGMRRIDFQTGARPIQDMLDASADNVLGTSVIVGMMSDVAIGDDGFLLVGSAQDHRVKSPTKDLVMVDFKAKANRSAWVKALHPKAARTAAHTTVGLLNDGGAASQYGGIGALQVFALTGASPVLAVKLQHSADTTNGVDGTWVDLGAAFPAVNAAAVLAGYAAVVTPAGTVNKRVRLVLTVTSGSLTSVTFAAQFGRNTVNN